MTTTTIVSRPFPPDAPRGPGTRRQVLHVRASTPRDAVRELRTIASQWQIGEGTLVVLVQIEAPRRTWPEPAWRALRRAIVAAWQQGVDVLIVDEPGLQGHPLPQDQRGTP